MEIKHLASGNRQEYKACIRKYKDFLFDRKITVTAPLDLEQRRVIRENEGFMALVEENEFLSLLHYHLVDPEEIKSRMDFLERYCKFKAQDLAGNVIGESELIRRLSSLIDSFGGNFFDLTGLESFNQGKGYGSILIEELISLDSRGVFLYPFSDVVEFYKKQGFSADGIRLRSNRKETYAPVMILKR